MTEEAPAAALASVSAPGHVFVQARERLGLSVTDAARQLRLSVSQITALEANNYASLPDRTFARGFIRNYSKLLQIDAQPLLHAYDEAHPQSSAPAIILPSYKVKFSTRSQRPWLTRVLLIISGVVFMPWLVYIILSQGTPATDVTTVQISLPSPPAAPVKVEDETALPALQSAAEEENQSQAEKQVQAEEKTASITHEEAMPSEPVKLQHIRLQFSGDSWVQIRNRYGKVLFSGLNRAGSRQDIQGSAPFSLIVGNATQVRITYNDTPVDLQPYINVDVARLQLE